MVERDPIAGSKADFAVELCGIEFGCLAMRGKITSTNLNRNIRPCHFAANMKTSI
jgi:hypothetical protein